MDRKVLVGLVLLDLCLGYSAATTAEAVDSVDQQLDALTYRVVSVSRKLDKILSDGTESKLKAVRFSRKLDRYQGKNGACLKGFFPCGHGVDGAVQCIHDYLVCDGSADCKSGEDEAPKICQGHPFVDPGEVKGRRITSDSCVVNVDPKADSYSVWTPSVEIIPWFPSRPLIDLNTVAPIFSDDAQIDVLVLGTPGFYSYATGNINAPFNSRHGVYGEIVVDWVATDKIHLAAYVLRQFRAKPCAVSLFVIETGDTGP